ncbi:nif-specific transcriptional activator NifA [Methylococcus sp. EFPC2]|uniref:nif-specific transcriptional activator NifA n=1 Tax=Methylococcus sp. EFPC2 TaxID=2812648 RepID=UPI0019676B6D|nr:nif-specific transcriptional activator NifA [Methylococcus sp. EFPC2]QSA99209.1 nif-specific transcriptional activator NifA [Methylococcus sp. EFPC2]
MQTVEKQDNLELVTIYEISKILGSSLDLGKTIREVLNVLSSHMHMCRCMIALVQDSGEVHIIEASGLSQDEIKRGRFQKGEGIIGKVINTGLPIVIPNIAEEPRFLNRTASRPLSADRVIAFVGIPIKISGATIGVLSIDREMNGYKGSLEHDVRLLKMVANLISQTLRLHQHVAEEREQMMHEQHRLQKEVRPKQGLVNVIGQSRSMQDVFVEVERAAAVNSTVLLRGESGTGKEMIANAIHQLSARSNGPFIRVNCAALSETLLESELFGHEKGAFTGATLERKGRFELADGGTLFLDEIGEISPAFQVKLLRVLQEREFERVGGNKPIQVDVRLIAATNRNLETAVTEGEFRADLYFRINVISIILPPLRDRREDIPSLVEHFLERFNRVNQRQVDLSQEAMQIMTECYWPGNVRELENCVERTAAMTKGKVIQDINLPCQRNMCFSIALRPITQIASPVPKIAPQSAPAAGGFDAVAKDDVPEFKSARERLIWAMEECGWVQAKAARFLGITTRQMHYALQKYHIEIKKL